MSNSFWMDDGSGTAGGGGGGGGATNQQYGWATQQQSQQDLGYMQFDYSQPSVAPNPSGYSAGGGYGAPSPGMFIPSVDTRPARTATGGEDYDNEPPLLEELGINFGHIREKTIAVLNPVGSTSAEIITDQDLAGPLVFCLLFGFALLLHGKLQFGYIYGIGGVGCVGMYALLNLMSEQGRAISFTCTASVLGYCLLPMAILSLLAAVLSFQGVLGYVVSAIAVFWCSIASSKLFVIALSAQQQRLLVAYPCLMLYSVFALLAIF